MKLSLFLFFQLILINTYAYRLTPKQEGIIREVMTRQFGSNTMLEPLNTGMVSLAAIGRDTFYTVDGFHYVFHLSNDTAIRVDNSAYHGGNFRRYQFVRGKSIFNLGGYGFYQTNNNLEVFNTEFKKWRIENTSGEKPEYINGLIFEAGDLLYSLYNYKSGNNVEQDKFDKYIYVLDLKTHEWKRHENINPVFNIDTRAYYSNNFIVMIAGNEALLINKKTQEFLKIGRDEFYSKHQEYFYEIDGDNIKFGSNNSFINLNKLWLENKLNAKKLILEPSWYQLTVVKCFTVILIVVLLITASAIVYVKRKSNRLTEKPITNNTEERINPIINKLLSTPKSSFTIEELDLLLEIDHMEFDSRKLKRHRLLSDLEKTHPGLIVRQKDETDKRRFIYTIQKNEQK